MLKLLIVDDSMKYLNDMESLLRKNYVILKAHSGRKALEILKFNTVDAVLLDLELPDLDGLKVLSQIHQEVDPYLPVIMVTDHGEVGNAVNAIKAGADDFIPKGLHTELLAAKLMKALEKRELEIKAQLLEESYAARHDKLVFVSDVMKKVNFQISRFANVDENVLLIGESGVGKDLIAWTIHDRSLRWGKPFVDVSVGSLNETLIEDDIFGHDPGAFTGAVGVRIGKFEAANGGTLYLPEISSLSEHTQTKLLHFLQYKSISRLGQTAQKPEIPLDVRIIMATNVSPEEQVNAGKMRQDFYGRISKTFIEIPPLRERREDIEPLIDYFLEKYRHLSEGERCTIDPKAMDFLKKCEWEGNVRAMEGAIEDSILKRTSSVLTIEDFVLLRRKSLLTSKLRPKKVEYGIEWVEGKLPKAKDAEGEFKRIYYLELLHHAGGKISTAAKIAGMSPQGLRKILKQLGIDLKE